MGPRLKPINHGTIHNGWELSSPCTERISYWRERQHNVQISTNFRDVEVPARGTIRDLAQSFDAVGDGVDNGIDFIVGEEIWDVTTGEQVVDVD